MLRLLKQETIVSKIIAQFSKLKLLLLLLLVYIPIILGLAASRNDTS